MVGGLIMMWVYILYFALGGGIGRGAASLIKGTFTEAVASNEKEMNSSLSAIGSTIKDTGFGGVVAVVIALLICVLIGGVLIRKMISVYKSGLMVSLVGLVVCFAYDVFREQIIVLFAFVGIVILFVGMMYRNYLDEFFSHRS